MAVIRKGRGWWARRASLITQSAAVTALGIEDLLGREYAPRQACASLAPAAPTTAVNATIASAASMANRIRQFIACSPSTDRGAHTVRWGRRRVLPGGDRTNVA